MSVDLSPTSRFETCRCGAQRLHNSNAGHVESGNWHYVEGVQ